jgi:four helix bundle protein
MAARPVRRFQDLDTWVAAMDLTVSAYEIAELLPDAERFELSAQIRRAAVSIPANVAEGHASGTDGLCVRHLRIALGSLGELKTLFELARRLAFVSATQLTDQDELVARVGQLLHGLLRSIRRSRA